MDESNTPPGGEMSSGRAPVIVAGMHRSGTSLIASFLSALGFEMGPELLGPDARNRAGYFEDKAFMDLNQRLLRASTRDDDGGYPDWGWTEIEALDRSCQESFYEEARELVESRTGTGASWGWKDPRNSLLLDFWDQFSDGAKFVLVYRFPWDVADSMQRLGADVFLLHPEYALQIWGFYNRHLLDFYRENDDRCLLVNTNALIREPEALVRLLQHKLGLDVPIDVPLRDQVKPELLVRIDGHDPLVDLLAETSPANLALLEELDTRADLAADGLWKARPIGPRFAATDLPAVEPSAPSLSIVIPCFEQGEWLVEAVASVERCLDLPYELIVVNDGSQQRRTLEVLEHLRGLGYNIIDRENGGLSAARNTGFGAAAGRFILPLDADNRLVSGFVEEAVNVLETSSDVGVVYGDRREFGGRSGLVEVPEFDIFRLLRWNYIDACAVIRREVWEDCGGYDPRQRSAQDWDLWLKAVSRGWKFHHLPILSFDYRVSPSSLSSTATGEDEMEILDFMIENHSELYSQHLTGTLFAAELDLRNLRDDYNENFEGPYKELIEYAKSLELHTAQKQSQVDRAAEYVESLLEHKKSLESYVSSLEEHLAEKKNQLANAIEYAESLEQERQQNKLPE